MHFVKFNKLASGDASSFNLILGSASEASTMSLQQIIRLSWSRPFPPRFIQTPAPLPLLPFRRISLRHPPLTKLPPVAPTLPSAATYGEGSLVRCPTTSTSTEAAMELIKRTYQPSVIKRKRTHGFRKRLKTPAGRKVLLNRLTKGRRRLAA